MKKNTFSIFAFLLVSSLLVSLTGKVTAAPLNDGPVVSAPSGGGTVTTTIIPVEKLPGTVANDAGTIYPQGHVTGDLAFSGDGVQVSGLVGYATLTMPLVNFSYGWSGSIYQFMNDQWVILPTSVDQLPESPNASASATIYSNGIYALMVSYHTPVGVDSNCPKMDEMFGAIGYIGEGVILFAGIAFEGSFSPEWLPVGSEITLSTTYDPGEGRLNGTTEIDISQETEVNTTQAVAFFEYGEFGFMIPEGGLPEFTWQVKINGCKYHLHFPEDFEYIGDDM
jgi:hypothetical protein